MMSAKSEPQKEQEIKAETVSNAHEKGRLPILLELTFDISKLILVVVSLAVAGISYLSGATWLDIALRTGVAMVVVGFILYVITRLIVGASIDATNHMLQEASKAESTMERQG